MKKIVTIILVLCNIVVFGQNGEDAKNISLTFGLCDRETEEVERLLAPQSTVANRFLSSDDDIKKYFNKDCTLYYAALNEPDFKKAIKILKKLQNSPRVIKEAANYQLFHAIAFGCFDLGFDSRPTNMRRAFIEHNYKQAKKYLDACNDFTKLYFYSDSTSAYYDLGSTISIIIWNELEEFTKNDYYKQPDMENFARLIEKYRIPFGTKYGPIERDYLLEAWNKKVVSEWKESPYRNKLTFLFSYCAKRYNKIFEKLSFEESIPEEFTLTKDECFNKGMQIKGEDYLYASYYLSRSISLGNNQGLLALISIWEENLRKRREKEIKKGDFLCYYWDLKLSLEDLCDLSLVRINPHIYETIKTYYNYYAEEKAEAEERWKRSESEKKIRREQRKKMWLGMLYNTLQAASQTMQYVGAAQYNNHFSDTSLPSSQALMSASGYNVNTVSMTSNFQSTPGYNNFGFSDAQMNNPTMHDLINPYYAIAQVNRNSWNEYMQFTNGGENMSYGEYQMLQGEAIQRMKDEGLDPWASFNAEKKETREDHSKRSLKDVNPTAYYNNEIKSGTSSNTSASFSKDRDRAERNNVSRTAIIQDNCNNQPSDHFTEQNNGDVKLQFHIGNVSSKDYEYKKKVNVYMKDGASWKIFMQNKELYKQGANSYVLIDGKFYPVHSGHILYDSFTMLVQ